MIIDWILIIKLALCAIIPAVLLFLKSDFCPTIKRYKLIQKLPGPKGVWILGNALEVSKVPFEDAIPWFSERLKQYEGVMRIWILGQSSIYIKEPEDIQTVFNNVGYIDKGLVYEMFKPWLGEGLLTSSGEKWHSRRKLLTPAFHFKILEDNLIAFNKCSKILCDKMAKRHGEEVELNSILTLCTLDIIMGTAMGVNMETQSEGGSEYVKHLKNVSALLTQRIMRPQFFINTLFNLSSIGRRFYKSVKYLHETSYKVIDQRRKEFSLLSNSKSTTKKKYRAFLDKLLEHEFENPGSFHDDDFREEVDTFMFEGHDTTSAALIFIFYNLSKYPDIQEKVYEELKNIFDTNDKDLTSSDLNKMIYTEKVIKESLRLYPSVPIVTRRLKKDLILKGNLIIPARTSVIAPIYFIHKNEKHWSNPDIFDPERFSEEETAKRHPYAYLPFSAGPRNCIGQKFAMMELKTVIAHVIRNFKVVSDMKDHDFKVIIRLVLGTSKPIKCRFLPRNDSIK